MAEVENQKGYVEIEAQLDKMKPASIFGPEFLTYVLWAVTPEGRATNLGELILDGDHGQLHVTTELQAFGLIVTAEPYFAVTQPSDVVVAENVIRKDTVGNVEKINAKVDLLKRGPIRRQRTACGIEALYAGLENSTRSASGAKCRSHRSVVWRGHCSIRYVPKKRRRF
jgi:hypothetical protein